jgi:anti-sigma-K factor RskA
LDPQCIAEAEGRIAGKSVSQQDQFRETVESYALGALDPEERALFEAHLGDCAECAHALDEARLVVSELAHLAPVAQPAKQLKQRILKEVRREATVKTRSLSPGSAIPVWLWAGVAALVVLSVSSTWNARRLQIEIRRLNEQAALEHQRRETLEKEFVAAQMQARILMDPRSRKIMLPAKDPKMPHLEAMWNPELGLCLMGQEVPMPSENRAFQLWLIPKAAGSKPMPVHAMMWPDADGKLMHVVEKLPQPMSDTKAIAVTEEPADGSLQPTSEPMWAGTVS